MNIGNLIARIAGDFYSMGNRLFNTGVSIQGVYLIGGALSDLLMNIGASVMLNSARLGTAASDIDNFVHTVLDRLGDNPIIRRLMDYANRLIAFIENPIPIIRNAVKAEFPKLFDILNSTYTFIKPYVEAIVKAAFSFLSDMRGFIKVVLGEVIKDYALFQSNPTKWIFDKLRLYSFGLSALLLDPDGWFKEKLKVFFPLLWTIIQDPKGFIMEKVIEGFETLVEKYLPRIMKIAERVINLLF